MGCEVSDVRCGGLLVNLMLWFHIGSVCTQIEAPLVLWVPLVCRRVLLGLPPGRIEGEGFSHLNYIVPH